MIFAEAVSGDAVNLALVAIVGSVITALFKLLDANTKAIGKLVHSSDKVAKATTKSAKEAKQRNGHLGDQSKMIAKLITEQNQDVKELKESNNKIATTLSKSALIAAEDRDILTATPQHVDTQNVEHLHVDNQDISPK
jgi:RNA binding exosome subunit